MMSTEFITYFLIILFLFSGKGKLGEMVLNEITYFTGIITIKMNLDTLLVALYSYINSE